MANIRTFFANAYEVTLAAQMGPTALSFEVTTVAGAPSLPAYMKITDPNNVNQREYVLASSVDGTTFTIASINDRYLAGSSAGSGITHEIGETVKCSPMAQMFDDLHDRVESRLATSAHTKTLHDGLAIDHASLSNLTAGDPHDQYLDVARHDTTSRHGSNVVDHGSIGGLGDDDHTQYLLKAGGTMTGDLALHAYRERRRQAGTSDSVTVSFAGEALVWSTRTGELTLSWSNIPAETDRVRHVTLRTVASSIIWPSGTRFEGGEAPDIEGECRFVLEATGNEVTVFAAGTEIG